VGITAKVIKPDVDESVWKGEKPDALVRRLSLSKARQVADTLRGGKPALVIAADTIVVAPGGREILGKPSSVLEARQMVRKLAGKKHVVYTGFCVISVGYGRERTRLKIIKSTVRMRALNDDEIRKYVATGEPMDKAGSYAAQGIGMGLIEAIDGSYTNVVGLPMAQLLNVLEKYFGMKIFSWLK
jgi:septum formation protein